MQHLRALCSVLDISLDQAVMGDPSEAKTAEEQAMLEFFRNSTDAGRQVLLAMGQQVGRTPTKS